MLSISHDLQQKKHTVSFSRDTNAKEEQRAIREDKKKVTTLLLESDVAFVVDKSHALRLLEEAKAIIDKRSFTDAQTKLDISSREKVFNLYGYSIQAS
jgi:hypothetical protein